MELVDGGSTADRLRIDGPLPMETICSVMEDMGHALLRREPKVGPP